MHGIPLQQKLKMEGAEEYYTHPDRMRGTTRRKQNAMMYQQFKAFEAILHTFQGRNETDSLYHALSGIIPHNGRVRSIHALHHYAKQWYSDREKHDQTTITRIDVFNHEIEQLKQMKTLFDERIYSVLFEFYYEMVMEEIPQATKLVDRGHRTSSQVRGSNLLVMSNIEGYAALNEPMPVERLYDISKDCEKLFTIIHQLQQVDVRWGSLLKSDEVDVELFDPDSVYDVKLYPNYRRFEAMLRLIPDVIRKIQRALELAKSWWYQAERIRRRLQGQKIRDDTTSDQPSQDYQHHANGSSNVDHPSTEQVLQNGHSVESVPGHSAESLPHQTPEVKPDSYDPYRSEETQRAVDEDDKGRSIDHCFNSTSKNEDNPLHLRETSDHISHTYPAVMETVESRLQELSKSIALGQIDLASETNELEFFNRRQQRIHKLRSNLKRTINAMEAMHDELKGYRRAKEQLLLQLEDADTLSYRRHVSGKLKNIDDKVKDIQELSQVIEYRHKLMTSDLKLELDLKETFTRYQNEVRGRVDLLQSSIRDEEEKKAQLVHELRLLRLQIGLEVNDQENTQDTESVSYHTRARYNRSTRKEIKPVQTGFEETNHENTYTQNKSRLNHVNITRSLLRIPTRRVGGVSRLSEQSLNESREEEQENKDPFFPDLLLLAKSVDSSQDILSDDMKPLDIVSSSPDHYRQLSNDNGVNENRNANQGNIARQPGRIINPINTYLMPETGENHSNSHKFQGSNRYSNKTQNKRKQEKIPEINYFPPSAEGMKKHRLPQVPENTFPGENKDVDSPSGHISNGFHPRLQDSYQDTSHHDGERNEQRYGQRMQPPPTISDNTLPTRNLNRRPRKSLGLNKNGALVKKQPLPQVREEESPFTRQGQTPRMYDPKREGSVLSSHSPLPINSSLSFDTTGEVELLGVAGRRSRKQKKSQRSKQEKKLHRPDLLLPMNDPYQTQRHKHPQVRNIPVKTTY